MKTLLLYFLLFLSSYSLEAQNYWGQLPFSKAKEMAMSEKKPLMTFFTAKWCLYCHILKKDLFKNVDFEENAGKFIISEIDLDKDDGAKTAEHLKVNNFPSILFFDAQGKELYRVEGSSSDNVVLTMKKVFVQEATQQNIAKILKSKEFPPKLRPEEFDNILSYIYEKKDATLLKKLYLVYRNSIQVQKIIGELLLRDDTKTKKTFLLDNKINLLGNQLSFTKNNSLKSDQLLELYSINLSFLKSANSSSKNKKITDELYTLSKQGMTSYITGPSTSNLSKQKAYALLYEFHLYKDKNYKLSDDEKKTFIHLVNLNKEALEKAPILYSYIFESIQTLESMGMYDEAIKMAMQASSSLKDGYVFLSLASQIECKQNKIQECLQHSKKSWDDSSENHLKIKYGTEHIEKAISYDASNIKNIEGNIKILATTVHTMKKEDLNFMDTYRLDSLKKEIKKWGKSRKTNTKEMISSLSI